MSRAGRARAVLGVLAVLVGLLGAPTAGAHAQVVAGGQPTVEAADEDRVVLLLTALEPLAPTASDTLTLRLRFRNDTADPVRALRLQVGVGPRLSTRSALAAADSGVGTATVRLARTVELDDTLAVGASSTATVAVPVADLRLGRLGVYPLTLTVSGRTDGARRTVGELRTFLPWFPDGVEAPVRVAFLLPLVAAPATGAADPQELGQVLAPTGRLGSLVAAGSAAQEQRPPAPPPVVVDPAPPLDPSAPPAAPTPPVAPAPPPPLVDPVPLTWAVDPALLEAVRSLTLPDPAADGVQAVATDFLAALTAATADRPVVPLPYADVDVVALERAGLGGEVLAARALGRDLITEVLPAAAAQPAIAWPPAGALTPGAARLLTGAGVRSVVLSDAALPPDPRVTFSAGALVGLDDLDLHAAVTDGVLDALVARQSGPPALGVTVPSTGPLAASAGSAAVAEEQASPRLALQRFLAETALIAAERAVTRDFVVAPPREWDPDPEYLTGLLGSPGRVPWMTGATLPDVLAGDPPAAERGELDYPDAARRAELSAAALTGTAALRSRLDSVASALTAPEVLEPQRRATLAATSASWRDSPGMPGRIRSAVRGELDAVAGAVRITTVGRVTLTSRTGQIPVTVSNDLDQPVRVRLDVQALQAARLADGPPQETVVVAPGARQTLSVSATVRTSGTFPVEVRLLSPQGDPLGPATELLLTSSAYGRTALGITLAAGAVLLVAVGVRLTRRGLRARAGDAP